MKKFYWIESTMKIPNLHNEAVQCQIFKALNVFCSSNLSIDFFVSIEFYDNQHENSHAVRGCGACLGIRAWRRLLWMVCYIIKEKFNWKLKIHASNLQLFVVSRKLELWKSENVSKSENKTDKIPWQRDEIINGKKYKKLLNKTYFECKANEGVNESKV